MNKANLKSYAPKARLDFIKAVTERANVLGISAAGVVPAEVRGDVALIDGREWPAKVGGQRDELVARIKRHGFEQTMDEVAYTWFNRFAALRYMEIHDYLGHGWRVLSSRDGGLPEILSHASEVTLPGLNPDRAREMQMAGNQDNELYKLLLVAQCNELSRVMPFLFERIDDETELLLPENLLRTDSIVAKLVEQVPEEDWQEIEVIGWLYQFYISEKKDQVIGKVVKSEDIPAATQLFTPNWIVQYLVQNSVGRLWLMANPTSTLASQWPYYIQPAEQTPEVQAQLDALIQTRIREDGETLNPETITVLDSACGSGHILVVAYDVLKAIYLERGYQPRSIPRLILEKNLYGLDIDDRAGQLSAFALLMKARADDRRLFTDPPKLNVLTMQESKGLDLNELATHLAPFGLDRDSIKSLLDTFEHAKSFGSLIQVPSGLDGRLASMTEGLQQAFQDGDLYARHAAKELLPIVWQALVLGMLFDAVVANPPYMGSGGMNALVKKFAKENYPDSKSDMFAMFFERTMSQMKNHGGAGLVAPFVWMFLSSYRTLREKIIQETSINNLIQLEYNAFEPACIPVAAFTLMRGRLPSFAGSFIKLSEFKGHENQAPRTREAIENPKCPWLYHVSMEQLKAIPGSPLAFWIAPGVLSLFSRCSHLGDVAQAMVGLQTSDNDRFLRFWWEVPASHTNFYARDAKSAEASKSKWFPHNKGGSFRKWWGNQDYVVNWADGGREIRDFEKSVVGNVSSFFRRCVSWSDLTSSTNAFRLYPDGFIFDNCGPAVFSNANVSDAELLCLLNNVATNLITQILNPTLHFRIGYFNAIPAAFIAKGDAERIASEAISVSRRDWDAYERSWDFQKMPLLDSSGERSPTLESCYKDWIAGNREAISRLKILEEENNRIFIAAQDLFDELSCDVPAEQITLTVNPAYRYRGDLTEQESWTRFRRDTAAELVSYAIGCMMGRYSLDEPGLVYANVGNIGFEASRYQKRFPADADGIVPITDERWFEDDAASRVRQFLRAVWGADTLEENMAWLAESLGTKGSETPDETIRRYLADKFFKDHLQTYKKRPIYWLFSSGKQGAFEALVYLHRYNEGTLARMRAEYVVPLIAKMASSLDMLDKDVASASSASARTKLQKQIEATRKRQSELLTYDEKLRHYADMRITLDLDDGVKMNYGKFGDLVAESKAITGGSDDT